MGMRAGGLAGLLGGLAGLVLFMSPLSAQTPPERSLPDAPQLGNGGAITMDDAVYGSDDETPLGVVVAGVRLIGPNDAVPAAPPAGISIEGLPGADAGGIEAALAPFIGQPLSLGLIARMQSAVAGVWRAVGYPFMSVTVPPQEVTSGVLTLRVVEFVAGTIGTDPAAPAHNAGLPAHLRQQAGAPISAPQLSEDLAWLNRNPFREVGAVFAPGDAAGTSDITLSVTEARPVSLHAGWDNTGSAATGRDRFFVGGGLWIPALNAMTVSWRFTRGAEIWSGAGPFSLDAARPGYLSAAGRIDLPTLPRQALTVAPSYIVTNELVAGTPISFRNRILELPILYRSAVSNILPGRYWGDFYLGVEPKWLGRETGFAGVPVADADIGLVNLVLGWSHTLADPHGRTSLDLRLKANPGGILEANTAAGWSAFTSGRVTDHTYVHFGFDIARLTALPHDLAWSSQLSGLVAGQALPDSERLGLGGHQAVRGYDGGDASVDAGVIWRNELRLPVSSPLAGAGIEDALSPFAFLDLGYGRDIASATDATLASAGLGFDYSAGNSLDAGLTAALALTDAGTTRAGDWTITANVRLRY